MTMFRIRLRSWIVSHRFAPLTRNRSILTRSRIQLRSRILSHRFDGRIRDRSTMMMFEIHRRYRIVNRSFTRVIRVHSITTTVTTHFHVRLVNLGPTRSIQDPPFRTLSPLCTVRPFYPLLRSPIQILLKALRITHLIMPRIHLPSPLPPQ